MNRESVVNQSSILQVRKQAQDTCTEAVLLSCSLASHSKKHTTLEDTHQYTNQWRTPTSILTLALGLQTLENFHQFKASLSYIVILCLKNMEQQGQKVAQWQSMCLTCRRSWIQTRTPLPKTQRKYKGKSIHNHNYSQHLSDFLQFVNSLSLLEFIVIHNGIITNYKDLKKFLVSKVSPEDTIFENTSESQGHATQHYLDCLSNSQVNHRARSLFYFSLLTGAVLIASGHSEGQLCAVEFLQ